MARLYLSFLLVSYCQVIKDKPRLVRELRNYFYSFNRGLSPVTLEELSLLALKRRTPSFRLAQNPTKQLHQNFLLARFLFYFRRVTSRRMRSDERFGRVAYKLVVKP